MTRTPVIVIALIAAYSIGLLVWVLSRPTAEFGQTMAAPPVTPAETAATTISAKSPEPEVEPVTLLAVGDIMLDRHVRTTLKERGPYWPFEHIRSDLAAPDMTIGNLEGPFTDHASQATNEHLIFTFDPAMAPVLRGIGFDLLSVANNHTLNFGQAGLEQTREVLSSSNIAAVGDPKNRSGFTAIQTVRNKRFGLVGYHGLIGGSADPVLEEIRTLRTQVDYLIVIPHWGVEYATALPARLQPLAHQFIDAGADVILGSHPHVIQPLEVYQGKPIFYSLGNFLFDQYFSQNTKEGLMVQLQYSETAVSIRLIPIVNERGQIAPLEGPRKQALFDRLANDSVLTDKQRQTVQQGQLTVRP